jgi:hypothetical protein
MADLDPTAEEYLAVVSEWSSYAKESTSRVGNAYPIFCVSRRSLVEQPTDTFPNPGYIFLVNRGELRAWDYVRIRPLPNLRYKDANPRECYFIARATPPVLEDADDCRCAVLLDVPAFDPARADSVLRSPRQNVTPIFYARNAQGRMFGPLRRVQVNRTGEETLDSIQWAPAGRDSLVYEFTAEDLTKQDLQLLSYEHPESGLNEVVHRPIHLLAGPVLTATSGRPHDRLAPAQLAEWYLRWRDLPEVPEELLKTFRTAPVYLAGTEPEIIRQRCWRLTSLFGTLEVLQAERRHLARKHLESPEGQQALEQQLALEMSRRAQSVEAEVKRRRSELADEEQRLEARLRELHEGQWQKEKALAEELHGLEERREQLQQALASLEEQARAGMEQLAAQLRANLPLLAALTAGRQPAQAVEGSRPADVGVPAAAAPLGAQVAIPEPNRALEPVAEESVVVDRLAAALAAERLYFTRDFLANLYVTLKASALNLIMGPPGYGKSSVVGGLARALGHGNALLEIAVRRTWSDDRYLLGFYDTFHGRYDPGPTGLATRLLQAQHDWEGGRQGLYLILLDEFNLAAPEYYFSQLLQLLTRPVEQRLLHLFDPAAPGAGAAPVYAIRLHPNVSFWGTINYDETTERLSPRLLDRTGMIFLTARDVLPSLTGAEAAVPPGGVPASQICQAFARPAELCPEHLWDMVEPLLDLLKQPVEAWGPGTDLSPRVIDGIKRYLANSPGLLLPVKAVDFVFQQRVLPALRGRGPAFLARTKALLERLTDAGLERSARHVRDALALAERSFGDLDFLAY